MLEGEAMKKREQWLAVIRTEEADEPGDRNESYGDAFPTTMVDLGSLAWQATKTVLGDKRLLPRDFELALVPGPEDMQ
jgi:hypothetical protein